MTTQVDIAQAVADETRLQILHRLMAELGKPQSLVSNHLAVLRDAGLVTFEREGRTSTDSMRWSRRREVANHEVGHVAD